MALDKPYLDVPGTIIFDAEQSRKGYWLNQFCMSLMKAENREKFKANERAYLDDWPRSTVVVPSKVIAISVKMVLRKPTTNHKAPVAKIQHKKHS